MRLYYCNHVIKLGPGGVSGACDSVQSYYGKSEVCLASYCVRVRVYGGSRTGAYAICAKSRSKERKEKRIAF